MSNVNMEKVFSNCGLNFVGDRDNRDGSDGLLNNKLYIFLSGDSNLESVSVCVAKM